MAVGLFESGCDHVTVGDNRSESLIDELDGDVWEDFFELTDERFDISHRLGWVAIHLAWFADKDTFHRLLGAILLEELQKVARAYDGKGVRSDLKRIGDSDAATFAAIIDSEDTHDKIGNRN